MKLDKLKGIPNAIKQMLKPEWKRLVLLVILFLILPQRISNDYTLFGGVYLVKYLFETYQPALDLYIFAIVLVSSYILVSFVIWIYDKKINKFIVTEGEEVVEVPEKSEQSPKESEEGKEDEEEGEEEEK
jgi:hypothetical protein